MTATDELVEADAKLTEALIKLRTGSAHLAGAGSLDPQTARHIELAEYHATAARNRAIDKTRPFRRGTRVC